MESITLNPGQRLHALTLPTRHRGKYYDSTSSSSIDACGDELVEFTNIEYSECDDIQSQALFDDYETESNDSGWLESVHDDQSYSEEDDQSNTEEDVQSAIEEDDQSHTEEDDQRQPEEDDQRQPEEDEASLDEILGGPYESESATDNEMKGDSGIIHLKYAIARDDKQVSRKKGLVHIIKKRTSRISVPAFLRRTKHGVSVDGANKNDDQSSERRSVSPLLAHDEGNLKDKLKLNRIGFRVQSFMRKEKSPRQRDNAEDENLEAVGTSVAKPSEDQSTKCRSVSPVLVRDENDKVKSKLNRIGVRVHSFMRKEKAKRDEEGEENSDAVGASLAKLRADQRSKHLTEKQGLVQDERLAREESQGNRAIFGLQSLQRNEKAKATKAKEDTRDDIDSYNDDISVESSVSGSRGTSFGGSYTSNEFYDGDIVDGILDAFHDIINLDFFGGNEACNREKNATTREQKVTTPEPNETITTSSRKAKFSSLKGWRRRS